MCDNLLFVTPEVLAVGVIFANSSSILVLLYYTQTLVCHATSHHRHHTSTMRKAQVQFLSPGPAP